MLKFNGCLLIYLCLFSLYFKDKIIYHIFCVLTLLYQDSTPYLEAHKCGLSMKKNQVILNTKPSICSAINMATGESGDPEKVNFDNIKEKAKRLWDSSPQPVKRFPWNRALENFVQLTLDLTLAVVKYLSVPVLAVSSLSEMSYCAHQRKLTIIPVPLLLGFVLAGFLKETALELSPLLKVRILLQMNKGR